MTPLMRLLNWIASNPQLLIWVVIIAAPVFKAVLKALGEQKRKRDAMLAAQRAQLEELRTGRASTPPQRIEAPVSARQQMEEAAARRRGQVVQAQRARQPEAPAQAPPAPPAEVRMTQVRLPGGIVMEFPVEQAPQPAPPAPTRPQQQRGQRRRGAKPVQTPVAAPNAETLARAARMEAQREAAREDQEVRARGAALAAGAPVAPPVTRVGQRGLGGVTRDELRRVFILREVFGPPLSMRSS